MLAVPFAPFRQSPFMQDKYNHTDVERASRSPLAATTPTA